MAARKQTVEKAEAYQVVGALIVIRKAGHERYVDRGGVFGADQLDEDNAAHLLENGLIAPFEVVEVPAAPAAPAFDQAAFDAAVDAKVAEKLAEAEAAREAAAAAAATPTK